MGCSPTAGMGGPLVSLNLIHRRCFPKCIVPFRDIAASRPPAETVQNRAFPCTAFPEPVEGPRSLAGTPGGAECAPSDPQSCAFVVTIAHDNLADRWKCPQN